MREESKNYGGKEDVDEEFGEVHIQWVLVLDVISYK
jgi:hypothetical protein